MNSYIDINRNKNSAREKTGRTIYALTEAVAILICGVFNFFYGVLSFLRSDVVSIVVRGISACVCAVYVIGTAGACEKGELILVDALIRVVIACAVFFIVYKVCENE